MSECHLACPFGRAINVNPGKDWELLHFAVLIMKSQICDGRSILVVKARAVQEMHAAETLIYADSVHRLGQGSSAVHLQVPTRELNNTSHIELRPAVDLKPLRQTGEIVCTRADMASFRERGIVAGGQIEQRRGGMAIARRNFVACLELSKSEILSILSANPLPRTGQD